MESVGPSDYVCLNCNLRFKNSKSYENHKRKFCQAQGGGNKSPVRDSGGYHGQLNVQTEFPLKTAASSVDFWKPSGSRNGLTSQGRYEVNKTNSFKFFHMAIICQNGNQNYLK